MIEQKVYYDSSRCKGCLYCLHNCPTKAISLSGQTNENGYEMISINQEKCVSCGTCYVVCPDYGLTVIKKAI